MGVEFKLYDEIGGWGITARELADALPADAKEVTLRINSPGGSVADGLAMHNFIKDHSAHVTAIIDGFAASAASFVMLGADEVIVHEGSLVFLHNPIMGAFGNAEDFRKAAKKLDTVAEAMIAIYLRRTGLERDELLDLLAEETFLTGREAVELGFADRVMEDEESQKVAAYQSFARLMSKVKEMDSMSATKPRKEIAAELADAVASLANVEGDRDQIKENFELAKAEIETLKTSVKDAAEAHEVAIGEINTKLAEVTTTNEEISTKLEKSEAELVSTKAALANPATADATLSDSGTLPASQADAEADEAEAKAKAEADAKAAEDAPTHAKWMAIKDARERGQYYADHRDAILADMDNQNEE